MSRSLTRIRSLVSEIEEIQRQAQLKAQGRAPSYAGAEDPLGHDLPAAVPPVSAGIPAAASDSALVSGRVEVTLSPLVVLAVRIQHAKETEVVEIKTAARGLEITFQDGKAFHIPFKNVA